MGSFCVSQIYFVIIAFNPLYKVVTKITILFAYNDDFIITVYVWIYDEAYLYFESIAKVLE